MADPLYLIAGATGTTGRAAVAELQKALNRRTIRRDQSGQVRPIMISKASAGLWRTSITIDCVRPFLEDILSNRMLRL